MEDLSHGLITFCWDKLLTVATEDVISINVKPELLANREKIRLTHPNNVVGFRRFYSESVEPGIVPEDWPHHILIKANVLDKLFTGNVLPSAFSDFMEMCSKNLLNLCAFNIGGFVMDLETDEGLLNLYKSKLNSLKDEPGLYRNTSDNNAAISDSARIFGKVLLGDNVKVGENAVIAGSNCDWQ